jgi:multidrug efflux pump subunit AcrB
MLALFMIYALLAVPLGSYVQPLIIMSAIPFGMVGAVWGHFLIGWDLNFFSMLGLVALAGVVVNDSLVLVDYVNRACARGLSVDEAARTAGVARFRAIMLTSLTTFAGLTPLLLERSLQAQFLIPMAVSIAFGVLFATAVTLILVPAWYLILDDLRALRQGAGAAAPLPEAS